MESEIMGSGWEESKNTSLIWQINFNAQEYDLHIHHCFSNDRTIACSWCITNRKKNRVRDRFIFYSRYSRRGTLLIQKSSGICSDETENWDLLVDCTSRDGRKMLDAGVHLSDKRTLLMKTHIPFQTQYNIFYRICFCFSKIVVKKQQIILFLKCFQIYCALSATARV